MVTISIQNSWANGSQYDDFSPTKEETVDALGELMNYPFNGKNELGTPLGRYNGAKRIDISRLTNSRIVRSPGNFLKIIKQLALESSIKPSYGLEIKIGNRKEYVHFLLELNNQNSVGIFYYDSKRMLAVNQIHKVERLVKQSNLAGAIIVANNIGIPAKQEANRINNEQEGFGIITIEQYSSIAKRNEEVY